MHFVIDKNTILGHLGLGTYTLHKLAFTESKNINYNYNYRTKRDLEIIKSRLLIALDF